MRTSISLAVSFLHQSSCQRMLHIVQPTHRLEVIHHMGRLQHTSKSISCFKQLLLINKFLHVERAIGSKYQNNSDNTASGIKKTISSQIKDKLSHELQPEFLDIKNESKMHAVPPGSETHFRVTVVSSVFEGQSLVQRHRKINQILCHELSNHIHALAIDAFSPSEWSNSNQVTRKSPPCRGGMSSK